MAYLILIMFFAALFGVFKPYIKGVKRWQFGSIAFVLVVINGAFISKDSTPKQIAAAEKIETPTSPEVSNSPSPPQASAAPVSNWSYSDDEDKMRNAITHFATVESTDTIILHFPYGEQKPYLTLRRSPRAGLNIYYGVPSGQILCNSFSSSHISVKFDDGPVENFGCTSSSSGNNDIAFIENEKRFLAKLRNAKKLLIEAEFYDNGLKQASFDVANLEWK